ncbi:LptA/OstA family protein [Clostridium tetani]|uniref:hypothetical protein n=1 Tax=Clostridium tetani TaxID=1513 RepID=UPI000A8F6A97|nr:hypothetical protein [Clostridium tetani]BDR88179.1 hypothetical protein N071400001_p11140 [Clostridium tetani]
MLIIKNKIIFIVLCIFIISGCFVWKNYNERPPSFIINNYLFVVYDKGELTSNEIEDYKGKKVGQTKQKTFFNPKDDGQCFKCPSKSSIFLVNRDKLGQDPYFKNRFSQTKGFDLLLINIGDKYYISNLVVSDVSKYNYAEELKRFALEFYGEYDL